MRKAIDMEMEKQMFDKQMFAGPCRDNGTQRNFNKQTLLGFSLSTHLVHTIFINGDSSLPGTGSLSTVFIL